MEFRTINQSSAETGISTSCLRRWKAAGLLPGFVSGSSDHGRFYVDLDELKRRLETGFYSAGVKE